MKKHLTFTILMIASLALSGCATSTDVQPALQTSSSDLAQVKTIQSTLTQIPVWTETPLPTEIAVTGTSASQITDPEEVIQNFNNLSASFNDKIKTTGWIRQVSKKVTFNTQTEEYQDWGVFEEWSRFDDDRRLIEAYNWNSTPEGVVEQESFLRDGTFHNVTYGTSGHGISKDPIDFTGGFANHLKSGENIAQELVTYNGQGTWKFSYEAQDGVMRIAGVIYFDKISGYILGKETYFFQPDGSLKLGSGTTINIFEVDAEPPLDRFQQIRDKGPK